MIFIISGHEDVHAQAVLAALARDGADAAVIDLRAFPRDAALTLGFGGEDDARTLTVGGQTHDLRTVRAVWWRRPQPYGVDPAITDPAAHNFVVHECHEAVEGLWRSLDATWINDPARDDAAARKVWQLDVAHACGLAIPRTLVTNDPARARAFAEGLGVERTIYKAFQGSEDAWRETRLLKPGELDQIDLVRHAPVIFQEYVPADADLRVTIVGDRIFPAAIQSREDAYAVDFRMDMGGARIAPCALPAPVETGLRRLMARLGLVYGAIDLRRTPEGEHVFLEINPAGQWLFVEDHTGQLIAQALAAQLSAADRTQTAGRAAA